MSGEDALSIYQVPPDGDVTGDGDDWHDMNVVNETGYQARRYAWELGSPGSPTYKTGFAGRIMAALEEPDPDFAIVTP